MMANRWMMIRECGVGGIWDIGFIDPDKVHEVTVEQYAQDTEQFLLMFLKRQSTKKRNTFSLQLQVSVTVLYTFYFAFPMLSLID